MITRRAALALVPTLLAAKYARAAEPQGVLHRGNRFEPASLDPHKTNTNYEANIIHDLFEGLMTYDAEGQVVAGLASAWSISTDGLRYTFSLRTGLAWSDGVPLTAEDVVYSFRRLMDPKTAAVFAQLMYVLKNGRMVNAGTMPAEALGVSAPTLGTVVLELETPAPYLLELLANAFAVMIPRHVITKAGDGWTRPGAMASSGAFMLESWVPQARIDLVRNPKFYDVAHVTLPRVAYIPTEDLTAALARFRAGELDMQNDIPLGQIATLRTELPVETRLTPTLLTYYLALNTTRPKLADPRVRRALSLAIDREVLTAKVLRGGEPPAYSFVPPMVAGYTPPQMSDAALSPEARLAEAQRLLAEAGYTTAKPLQIIYSHSANLELRRIGVIIASMWKQAGVQASLFNTEGRVHFANLRQGDFDVGFVGWSADFNDASSFLYVLNSASVNSNYSRYHNPAYDGLLAKAAETENAGARAGLLREAEEMALKDQPIIPLYFGVTKNLVSQRVVGWRANPVDVHQSRYLSVTR